MIPPDCLKRAGEMVEEARKHIAPWAHISEETVSIIVWALAEDLQRTADQERTQRPTVDRGQ